MAYDKPLHLKTIKYPKPCKVCNAEVNTTGWLFNGDLYCEQHRPGNVDQQPIPQSTPKWKCPFCGEMYAENGVIIRVDLPDTPAAMNESERICERCDWLRHAQYGLKINGLWRVPKKRNVADVADKGATQ